MPGWKVQWVKEDGHKTFRKFDGKSPSEAVTFAKGLKRTGLQPNVISMGRRFPPTPEQEKNRKPGMVWCPYCVKWRKFRMIALKRATYTSDALMRCPVCFISTEEFWVKKYNGFLEHMSEVEVYKRLSG